MSLGDAARGVESAGLQSEDEVLAERRVGGEGDLGVVGEGELLGVGERRIGSESGGDGMRRAADLTNGCDGLDSEVEVEEGSADGG